MIITNTLVSLINDAIVDLALFDVAGPGLQLALVKNNFTPGLTTAVGSLEYVIGNGLDSKVLVLTSGQIFPVWDVPSGRWGYCMREPAGGFNYVVSTVPDPAITIYGYALVDDSEVPTELYASALLPAPIPITAPGQIVQLSAILGFLTRPPIGDLPIIP